MLAFAGMFSLRTAVLAGLCTVAGVAVAGAQSIAPPPSLPPVPAPASAQPAALPAAPPLPPPPVPAPSTGAGPSLALGVPWCGWLVRGVPLATGSGYFFTWDLTASTGPNPAWRRHGTGRLVSVLRRVTAEHHRARTGRPRVGIADLSLPRGGPFGPSYGGLGHLSHQNGLDADVLYPRRDRLEAPPDLPGQIDRANAQALVDRFVAAGAQHVFVGRGLGLRGPRGVVVPIAYHLDHMHVRLAPERPARAPRRCPWKPL
jgi:hypothetical protein